MVDGGPDAFLRAPRGRFPSWLRKSLPAERRSESTRRIITDLRVETVCDGARCPNRGECFSRGEATFMILGERCTRSCVYCAVPKGGPFADPDPSEPERVARAVKRLGLRHAVVTSVTRDDLPDEGAAHFEAVVRAIKRGGDSVTVEILTPDFRRTFTEAARRLSRSGADVLSHNLETVRRLFGRLRPVADYDASLRLLALLGKGMPSPALKSGAMLGMGETASEVEELLGDIHRTGCRMVTLGQYLPPDRACPPVRRFVAPEEFERFRRLALGMGFKTARCGPFVRSSYGALEDFTGFLAAKDHVKIVSL